MQTFLLDVIRVKGSTYGLEFAIGSFFGTTAQLQTFLAKFSAGLTHPNSKVFVSVYDENGKAVIHA